ncbi:hypothetical protein BAE44_0001321 [Dichanthelium oligosanthes]|uniref:Uncharacterized protein n=1 Tax=Dichanthelium oligosanthes TaxID=888268 RepID=A0A1E5WKJ5_9POAL|nr:hypothetical protein BAE44_0001321 [Dichanthelium oligosanthes]
MLSPLTPDVSCYSVAIKLAATMAYEAAAAVALRDQSQLRSREDKGGAGSRRQQQAEEKAVMMCGVLRILRRVLPFSKSSGLSEKK